MARLAQPPALPRRQRGLVYCAHTVEHLYVDECQRLLREFRRVLRGDGVLRLVTPSFEHALRIAAGHPAEDPQRRFPHASGQAIDYLFCDGQHRYAYSWDVMRQFLADAGFGGITNVGAEYGLGKKTYGRFELGPELAGSLLVEATR